MLSLSSFIVEASRVVQESGGGKSFIDEPSAVLVSIPLAALGTLLIVRWERAARRRDEEQDAVETAAHEVATTASSLAVMLGPITHESTRLTLGRSGWERLAATWLTTEIRVLSRAGYVKAREDRFPLVAGAVQGFTDHAEVSLANATSRTFDWSGHQAAMGDLYDELRRALVAECQDRPRRRLRARWRPRRQR